jgi:hypothetical protein
LRLAERRLVVCHTRRKFGKIIAQIGGPPGYIAKSRVLSTMIGGKTDYEARN